MEQAREGNTVRVHYTGTLDDGSQFDSSQGREPLEFTLGAGQVIAGFEQGVTDMTVGETKRINIAAKDAYGEYRPELVMEMDRSHVPADMNLELGMQLQMKQGEQVIGVRVVELSESAVTLDANHPLAGQDLTFELEVMDIQ